MLNKISQQITKINFFIILLSTAILFSSCGFSFSKIELKRGKEAEKEKDYNKAIEQYYRFIKRYPKDNDSFYAGKRLYQIAKIEKKDFVLAEKVLNYLLINSQKEEQRNWAQFELGDLYFHKNNEYLKAIDAFSKYSLVSKEPKKKLRSKINIAKSYFYLNKVYQAGAEIDEILKTTNLDGDLIFEAKLLKANIFTSNKDNKNAIPILEELIKKYPEQAEKEQVAFSLSLSFEEDKQFEAAIKVLKDILASHPNPSFIQSKIVRLEFLKKQQPGARGKVK